MTGAASSAVRVKEAGDAALLIELDAVIDVAVNARAVAIAGALARLALPGVRDIVPSYRSVAVHFDPLLTSIEELEPWCREAAHVSGEANAPRLIEIPVVYGGENGPDLAAVAAATGKTEQAVIRAHADREYRVFALGFLPGFAYMGVVDPVIAVPRSPLPRPRVPAGSVGIAGQQTGIYPMASPGGWQLIGRTSAPLFEPARTPPALFAQGDRVRCVPVDRLDEGRPTAEMGRLKSAPTSESSWGPALAGPHVTVLKPGLLTTIQDSGRWGHQAVGVSVAGAADLFSHRLANALLGNGLDAATLEATIMGPELRLEHETSIAVTGADLAASLDGERLPIGSVQRCPAGSVLRFRERKAGARSYLGIEGGFHASRILGSRSTHMLTGVGPAPLKAGDRLTAEPAAGPGAARARRSASFPLGRIRDGGATLRVLRGPQADQFSDDAIEAFVHARYVVSPHSNRMACRLRGPAVSAPGGEMISDATFTGAIQIPPSGEPMLLLADRQTIGGYPQIAVVISADLPVAGQLAPGDWIQFELCGRADALTALHEQEALLAG